MNYPFSLRFVRRGWALALTASVCLGLAAGKCQGDEHFQNMGRWRAGKMKCLIWVVLAEDGSAVGLYVALVHTDQKGGCLVEDRGAELSLRVMWQTTAPTGGRWRDEGPPRAPADAPTCQIDFQTGGGRYAYYVPFSSLMTKPLPTDTVAECELAVCPNFYVRAVKAKNADDSGPARIPFTSGKGVSSVLRTRVTLRRSTIETAVGHYKPKTSPLTLDDVFP